MPSAAARFLTMRERGLRAFLHHVAELAGQDQPPAAGNARRLDEQDVAADRRPGKPGRDAGHAGAHRHLVLELRRAEDRDEIVARDARSARYWPSAMRTAAWRSVWPICRSRLRTPASRV